MSIQYHTNPSFFMLAELLQIGFKLIGNSGLRVIPQLSFNPRGEVKERLRDFSSQILSWFRKFTLTENFPLGAGLPIDDKRTSKNRKMWLPCFILAHFCCSPQADHFILLLELYP